MFSQTTAVVIKVKPVIGLLDFANPKAPRMTNYWTELNELCHARAHDPNTQNKISSRGLQDFICPPKSEIFSVYLGHARAHDNAGWADEILQNELDFGLSSKTFLSVLCQPTRFQND